MAAISISAAVHAHATTAAAATTAHTLSTAVADGGHESTTRASYDSGHTTDTDAASTTTASRAISETYAFTCTAANAGRAAFSGADTKARDAERSTNAARCAVEATIASTEPALLVTRA